MYPYTRIHSKFDKFKLKIKYRFHRVPSTAPILFVTGASANHFKTLLQFLCNFSGLRIKNPEINLTVWDLGLTPYQLDFLKSEFPNFEYHKFEFEKYPDWFDIKKEGGRYAWKPEIIANSVDAAIRLDAALLCWIDAGNLFHSKDLGPLIHYLNKYGIYSPDSSGVVSDWVHPKMLDFFKVTTWPFPVINLPMRNASFIGFNLKSKPVCDLIAELRSKSAILECIAPTGSDKSNHRQDQSLFTLLYYQYIHQYKHPYNDRYFGFSVQNDVDA